MKLSENPSVLGRPNIIFVMETSLFDIFPVNNVTILMKNIFGINIREVNYFIDNNSKKKTIQKSNLWTMKKSWEKLD